MELTTRGRYAVMAMAELASQSGSASAPLSQIAERQGLPLSYLEQIFGALRRAGLVESSRGRTGGYRLARAPSDISVNDVMLAVEEATRFTRCSEDDSRCSRDKPCVTHNLWTALGGATSDFFARVTLAEVATGAPIDFVRSEPTDAARKPSRAGRGRIYLDHNATAPLRPEAKAAISAALDVVGNPSSVHAEGRAARALIETAREQVAALVGAKPSEVVFTGGATEANAWVMAQRWTTIVTSAIEHESVLAPARASGANVVILPAGRDGLVRTSDLGAIEIAGRALASVQAANNETGVVQPVAEIVGAARERGCLIHVDAVQAVGRLPFSFAGLGIDFASVSAHKLGGPKGVGALIVRDRIDIAPMIGGGGQERRRRAGTENVAAIAGFGAAAEAALTGLADIRRIAGLRDAIESGVREMCPTVTIAGAGSPRLANTSSIAIPGSAAETLVIKLDLAGIAISAGAACSSGKVGPSHVLSAMGLGPEVASGAIRISLGPTTSEGDVAAVLDALRKIVSQRQLAA